MPAIMMMVTALLRPHALSSACTRKWVIRSVSPSVIMKIATLMAGTVRNVTKVALYLK